MSSSRTVFFIAVYLERQVVGTISSCRLNWREWGCATGRRSWLGRREWSIGHGCRLNALCSGLCGCGVYTSHGPCTNIVEPTSVVFVGIYVEAYTELFTGLYVKLCNTFSTKYAEYALLGELVVSFDYIVLRFPRITCTRRDTSLLWENGNDFSFNFHNKYCI